MISDHAPGGETQALAAKAACETLVLEDPANPGPGAGWANAAKAAIAHFPDAGAIWYLDDDVVIAPDTLGLLLGELEKAGAEAIAPLLEDASGKLWAFPEPEPVALRKTIRQATTPTEARRLLGEAPVPFCWCTGACFLVRQSAIEQVGWHRTDFWLLGEDLEYSMRLAGPGKAVFTCKISVPHLPPSAANEATARRSDYLKFCSLLQNLSYLSFHARHSRHLMRYLPGNFRRLFRTHGFQARTLRDAAACFWNGAVRAKPSGTPSGETIRNRIRKYEFAG